MSAATQNEMERLLSERDGMKRQLDEALEREAVLAAQLDLPRIRIIRELMDAGIHPDHISKDLARRDLIKKAEVLELAESAMTNKQDAATMRLNAANLRQRAAEL